jgi:hypothetical protein
MKAGLQQDGRDRGGGSEQCVSYSHGVSSVSGPDERLANSCASWEALCS